MPSDIALNITSGYQDGGMKKAIVDTKALGQEVSSTSQTMSSNYDAVFKKLERPVKGLVFGQLADQAIRASGATANLTGATGALARGFESVSSVLMFLSPELAGMAIAGTALIAIWAKISQSTNFSAENIKKTVEQLSQQKKEYSESADILQKYGVVSKEQASILKEASNQSKQEIQDLKDKIKLRQDYLQSQITIGETSIREKNTNYDLATVKVVVAQRQKEYNDLIKAMAGFLPEAIDKQKAETKAVEDHYKALGQDIEVRNKLAEISKQQREFADIDNKVLAEMVTAETQSVEITKQLLNAKTDAERQQLQAHLDFLQKEIQSDQQLLQSKKQVAQQLAQQFNQYNSALASSFEKQNGRIVFNQEKFAADMIRITANQISQELAFAGMRDILTGNIGKGVAELAGSAAIAAAGGIASAALGPDSATGSNLSSTPGGGGQSGVGTANTPNQTNLTVEIRGGYFDDKAVLNLMDHINRMVNQNNVPLVSSVVKPAVGQRA